MLQEIANPMFIKSVTMFSNGCQHYYTESITVKTVVRRSGVCTVGPIVFRSQTWLLRFSNNRVCVLLVQSFFVVRRYSCQSVMWHLICFISFGSMAVTNKNQTSLFHVLFLTTNKL